MIRAFKALFPPPSLRLINPISASSLAAAILLLRGIPVIAVDKVISPRPRRSRYASSKISNANLVRVRTFGLPQATDPVPRKLHPPRLEQSFLLRGDVGIDGYDLDSPPASHHVAHRLSPSRNRFHGFQCRHYCCPHFPGHRTFVAVARTAE